MQLDQSTAFERPVFMVDASDHITGLAGLTLTITASKAGAAFASITPTQTDLGNGWYNLTLTTTHTNTVGALAFHITGTAADPLDFADQVIVPASGISVPTNFALMSIDSNGRVKGLIGLTQAVAFTNFQFRMIDANGDAVLGLVDADFTKKAYSIAGGAQGGLTGTITEDPGLDGFYLVDLSAGELSGRSISLVFEATGTITTALTIWPSQ